MDTPFIDVSYAPWVVVVSYLIASFASYVALDLAKRVRVQDRLLSIGWWAGGSLALGTGIWSMHFVGMLAMSLPFAVGYGYVVTALSWVAAVVVMMFHSACVSGKRLGGSAVVKTATSRFGAVRCSRYWSPAAPPFH